MSTSLTAPPELTARTVRALCDQLREAQQGPGPRHLDLSAVDRMDVLGAQLVLAAHRAGFEVGSPSEAARTVLARLGVLAALEPSETAR